jgi:serine/threonine-protein kinase RsbW
MTEPAERPRTGLKRAFDGRQLTSLRHAVTSYAAACGLADERLEDFVLSVNEIMMNVVRHGGGSGSLELRLADHHLTCWITDDGPGIPAHFMHNPPLPPIHVQGGRGLWVSRQLCDKMIVTTGETGTTVELVMSVPGGGADIEPLTPGARTTAE